MYSPSPLKKAFFLNSLIPLLLLTSFSNTSQASYSFNYNSSNSALLYATIFGTLGSLWYACDQGKMPCGPHPKLNFSKLTLSYDQGKDNSLIHQRIALGADWAEPIYQSPQLIFKSRLEVNLNHWQSTLHQSKVKTGTIMGMTPLFLFISPLTRWVQPYIELGIGPQWMTSSVVENKNKSTQFQFSDQLGIGVLNENMEISLRFIHFSNANIEMPNPGLDTVNLHLAVKF